MDVTLVIVLIGAISGVGSLAWQIRSKRRERAQVVVRSWWEASDPWEELLFVIEARNQGTAGSAELVTVGYEVENLGPIWMERENTPSDQRIAVDGSATLPLTLSPQHRAVFRLPKSEVIGEQHDHVVPIVKLGSGPIVRGDKAPLWPDRLEIPRFDPTE